MKVVYVSAYDEMGERFNGMVLHKALNRMGHRSDFAVMDRSLSDEGIHRLGGPVLRFLNRVAAKLENRLSLQATLPILGLSLRRQRYFREADLVHLQLLHARSFLSLVQLPMIAAGARPVLWTIHDPWATTGHCVHPLDCHRWTIGCGDCPQLATPLAIRRDTTAWNWRLKRSALRRSKIHVVVASQWMHRRLSQSPILAHLPSTVIPFGVDLSVFSPRDKTECRKRMGIPVDARVVALRWAPWNVWKGTLHAIEALNRVHEDSVSHIICFDSSIGSEPDSLSRKFKFVHLGWVDNDDAIATALSAADLFVMPSIAETFGMMAIESMACGTPVIVFEGTSLPEVVRSPHAGVAVPLGDSGALANVIQVVLQDRLRRQSLVENGLELVAREYKQETYIQRHLDLYNSLLDGQQFGNRRAND